MTDDDREAFDLAEDEEYARQHEAWVDGMLSPPVGFEGDEFFARYGNES